MRYRVFISSTFEDLKDFRASATRMVKKQGLEPVVMEDYTASDLRPVEKCLDDVRSSHIFVGIVAFRYGFIPEGYKQSITYLEYETAGKNKIPRLMFLISEKAGWIVEWIDGDRHRINEFRESIRNMHVTQEIESVGEFEVKLDKALEQLINSFSTTNAKDNLDRGAGNSSEIEFSPLLPYLCDRSLQNEELRLLLTKEYAGQENSKPVVCIVHGHKDECHLEFLKKVRGFSLPDILEMNKRNNTISMLRIVWPRSRNPADWMAVYKSALLNSLGLNYTTDSELSDIELIVQNLNEYPEPVLLYSDVMISARGRNVNICIEQWLDFWANFPELMLGKRLFVFLSIKYDSKESENKIWNRIFQNSTEDRVRRLLDDLEEQNDISGRFKVLSELSAIPEDDLSDWISNFVDTYCNDEYLEIEVTRFLTNKISSYYQKHVTHQIRMSILVDEIKATLEELKLIYPLKV